MIALQKKLLPILQRENIEGVTDGRRCLIKSHRCLMVNKEQVDRRRNLDQVFVSQRRQKKGKERSLLVSSDPAVMEIGVGN